MGVTAVVGKRIAHEFDPEKLLGLERGDHALGEGLLVGEGEREVVGVDQLGDRSTSACTVGDAREEIVMRRWWW